MAGGPFSPCRIAGTDDDMYAGLRELAGDFQFNALVGAGDERNAVGVGYIILGCWIRVLR